MRRLVRHLLVIGTASAAAAAVVAAGVSGPEVHTEAAATAAAPPATAAAPPSTGAPDVDSARNVRGSRGDLRPELTSSSAIEAAEKRAAALAKRAKVAAKKAKLEQAREHERAKRRAAAKAAALAAKRLGYDPGTTSPRQMAKQIMKNRFGYGLDQFRCFNSIIMRESRWDVSATNPSSGAYGIPQALPGSKMASIAGDWRTNPATQIVWGVKYTKHRYGSPCSAWAFKSSHGWY